MTTTPTTPARRDPFATGCGAIALLVFGLFLATLALRTGWRLAEKIVPIHELSCDDDDEPTRVEKKRPLAMERP